MVIRTLMIVLSLVMVVGPGMAQDREAATRGLHRIFDDYEMWRRVEFPRHAFNKGDYTHANRITDVSLAAIERRHTQRNNLLARLRGIDRDALNETEQINYDMFERLLELDREGHQYRTFLAPLSNRSGPQQTIPQMSQRVRFDRVEDFESYLSRLGQATTLVQQTIEKLKAGVEEARVPPRLTVENVPKQINALLADGGLDALREPFSRWPDTVSAETRQRIETQFEDEALPQVRAALTVLRDYITESYLPACREDIAAAGWPDGANYYNYQLKVMTTTDLTAEEIHAIGLEEVARLRTAMIEVIQRSDFLDLYPQNRSLSDDALFAVFIEYLRTDDRFYHDTPEALLAGYRDICKKVDLWMPRLFETLPRLSYGVEPIPAFMAPHQTTAYYQRGSLENAQAGVFAANTYALDQRPKYEMVALALHEAVPGHHHQIALAQEQENLPAFRRDTYLTAFGEGWALYAESLGTEMGLYEDPYDEFGRLLYEMWRACRLVVDPGMHAMGWTRQQAIDYMKKNTALSDLNIQTEVDRYIAWPGQATGYKIGELRIQKLRDNAEAMLGEDFDLRAFHDQLLINGAIPLPLLEEHVQKWIHRQMMPGMYD